MPMNQPIEAFTEEILTCNNFKTCDILCKQGGGYMELKSGIFAKAIKITGGFEGILAGNFDGMYLSFGYLQWSFGSGTLQPLFMRLFKEFPQVADKVLPKGGLELKQALISRTEKKWALTIQRKNIINSEWVGALKILYNTHEFQSIMADASVWYKDKAISLCNQYNIKTDRAFCLFFDIVVQLGNLKQIVIPNTNYLSKLTFIANQAILMALKKWQLDVKKRKMAIVMGKNMGRGWDTSVIFNDLNAFE